MPLLPWNEGFPFHQIQLLDPMFHLPSEFSLDKNGGCARARKFQRKEYCTIKLFIYTVFISKAKIIYLKYSP